MNENDIKDVKIKEFFKSSIVINDLEETLKFKPDSIIGIDQVSSNTLSEHGFNNIEELAQAELEELPLEPGS